MLIAIIVVAVVICSVGSIFLMRRSARGAGTRAATTMRIARPGSTGRSRFRPIVVSIAVAVAFLVFTMIGTEIGSRVLIIIVGSLASLYFVTIVFLMERSPERFEALFSQFGIALQNGRLSEKQAKSLTELRFLAVPFAIFSAYLALVPSWRVFGYLLVLTTIALALTLISYWKGWESDVWHHVHRVTLIVCLGVLVIFAISTFLHESDAGAWVKQKVVDYWNKPTPEPVVAKKAAEPAAKTEPVKKSVVAPPASTPKAEEGTEVPFVPARTYTPPSTPEPVAAANDNSDDDALAHAAEAALKAKAEALKDESTSRQPTPQQANPAINRRDEHGRLKPSPPMPQGNGSRVRVIRIKIPSWVK